MDREPAPRILWHFTCDHGRNGIGPRGAREKLCVAQTHLGQVRHREMLEQALDIVDRVGVYVCPDWSRYDEPTLPAPQDEPKP